MQDFEAIVARLQAEIGGGPEVLETRWGQTIPYFGRELIEIRDFPGAPQEFHLIARSLGVWVVVAAFDEEGNLIVVPQLKYGVGKVTIQFSPGGVKYPDDQDVFLLDDDEVIAASQQTFLQETGYAGGSWSHLRRTEIDDNKQRDRTGQHGLVAHLLMATDLKKVAEPQPKSTEFYEVIVIPAADIPRLLASEYFTELSARACLMEALLLQGRLGWTDASA